MSILFWRPAWLLCCLTNAPFSGIVLPAGRRVFGCVVAKVFPYKSSILLPTLACSWIAMLGIMLGLAAAAAFGGNSIITRRGVLRASPNYVANISIFSGFALVLLAAIATGDILNLSGFTWKTYLFFVLSGTVNFVLGRTFGYKSIQLIGSNRSNVVTGQVTTFAVIIAVVVLREPVTPIIALGVFLALVGPLLIAWKERAIRGIQTKASPHGKEVDRRTLYMGLLYGACTAVFWAASPTFVKLGLENGGSPFAGSLVAYIAASLAIAPMSLNKDFRAELLSSGGKTLHLAIATGVAAAVAQVLRYFALAVAPVTIVALMGATQPAWVMVFAFLFNRKQESFSRWVFLGNTVVLIGTILVIV